MAIVVRKAQVLLSVLLLGVLLVTAAPSFAATPTFGELHYNGEVVRTLVPPGEMTREGVDDLYAIPNQSAVTAVAPGDPDYRGGQWAVHSVTWNEGVTPYLLTSADAVLAGASAGDVTITRVPGNDFTCPIQPYRTVRSQRNNQTKEPAGASDGLFYIKLPRSHLPGTGVKIALAEAHFHGFGVARQGLWITWVNNSISSMRGSDAVRLFDSSGGREPLEAVPVRQERLRLS